MDMTGKSVLVTGAASGLGRATALRYAAYGAAKVACLDIHDEGNAETAAMIRDQSAEAFAVHVDLGDVDSIGSAYGEALAQLGRLDAAAHIGGYSWRGGSLDVTKAHWDTVMNVNLRGTFFCCQAALKAMYGQKSGAIVNMSADAAFFPVHGFAVQAAGKGGVALMTRTFGLEAARRGVRVNAVSPGNVIVQHTGASWAERPPLKPEDNAPSPAGSIEELAAQMAPGRFIEAEEVANVFVFFSSDAASGISGQTISVNGGGYYAMQL